MAFHWLTKDEKEKVRDGRKKAALEAAAIDVYGDMDTFNALKGTMHQRAHVTFDKMTLARINAIEHDHKLMGTFSKAMRIVLFCLRDRACTLKQLTAALVAGCSYSTATARREAQALTSILVACDRATKRGHKLEIK